MRKIGNWIIITEQEFDEKTYEKVRNAVVTTEKHYEGKIELIKSSNKRKVIELESQFEDDKYKLGEYIQELEKRVEELTKSRAGYKSRNSFLEKNKKILESTITDLKSDRYLIREIHKDRSKSHQQMKVKSCTVSSHIAKKVHS